MSGHVDALIDDYVLGILQSDHRREVDQHVAECQRCMQLLSAERMRTARLTAVLRGATLAPAGRIEVLWPGIAAAAGVVTPRRSRIGHSQWRTVLVSMAVALLAVVGIWGTGQRIDGWLVGTHTPTADAVTIYPTAGHTPTASFTPTKFAAASVAYHTSSWGTPAPTPASPQPEPIPLAPSPITQ